MSRSSTTDRLLLSLAMICSAMGCAGAAANTPGPSQPQAATATPSTPSTPGIDDLVPIPNARRPLPGLLTGGPPSEANLLAAKAAGFTLVVSLLPEDVEQQRTRAEHAGLAFESIPVASARDLTPERADRLAAILNAHSDRRVILHCGSGNRAGALLALAAHRGMGYAADRALQLGLDAGLTRLRDAVEQRLTIEP